MSKLSMDMELTKVLRQGKDQSWEEYMIRRYRIAEATMWHAFCRLDEEQQQKVIELARKEQEL